MSSSFAGYLKELFVRSKGYEAAPSTLLGNLSQTPGVTVLHLANGLSFQILVLVDRNSSAKAQFHAPPEEELKKLAADTKQLRGRAPLVISVYEIGLFHENDIQRAAQISKTSISKTELIIQPVLFDPATGASWSKPYSFAGFVHKRRLHKLYRTFQDPIRSKITQLPDLQFITSSSTAAMGLILAIIATYCLQVYGQFRADTPAYFSITAINLISQGGNIGRALVADNQWYRLLSAMVLHGGVFHLLMNLLALYFTAPLVQHLVGARALGALFFVCGLGGSIASAVWNPESVVSVGASGAIMGLMAFTYVYTSKFRPCGSTQRIQAVLLQSLIPSLIPLTQGHAGSKIDFAAHIGGALVGAAIGYLVSRGNHGTEPTIPSPRIVTLSISGTVVSFVVAWYLCAFGPVALNFTRFLAPPDAFPTTEEEVKSRLSDLLKQYPRDSRLRYLHALQQLEDHQVAEATDSLQALLADREILDYALENSKIEAMASLTLAEVYLAQDKAQAAKDIAKMPCALLDSAAPPGKIKELCARVGW